MTLPPFQPAYDSDEADAIAAAAVICDDCGRGFANARGLAIHRGRTHRPAAPAKRAAVRTAQDARNGKLPASAADDLRDLVAKFDRLAELRIEVVELERDVDALQQRLAKAWQR